jgi:TetR/AcrR family transcriptional regulator
MKELSTEEKIVQAAKEVFTQKGYAAARTDEIAIRAGVNKGLLQYYFKGKSKEKLFKAIFEEAFLKMITRINIIFESEDSLEHKIELVLDAYFDLLLENPNLPGFIVNELHTNTHAFVEEIMQKPNRPNPMPLLMQIMEEAAQGKIRPVNPVHLILNVLSMTVFPFIARPLFQRLVNVNDETFMDMMRQRKAEILDFVKHAIKP